MKNKIPLFAFVLLLSLTALASATSVQVSNSDTSYIYKINTPVDLKIRCFTDNNTLCSTSNVCKISVDYPNGTNLLSGATMTQTLDYYNYTLNETYINSFDKYTVTNYCNGTTNGFSTWTFTVTGNGKPNPDGIIIVFFSILLLVIAVFSAYLIIYSLGHVITLDFDIIDLALNLGAYIGLVIVFILERFYVGNIQLETYLELALQIGAVTNLVLPFIYFVLTLTMGSYMQKRVKGVDYA